MKILFVKRWKHCAECNHFAWFVREHLKRQGHDVTEIQEIRQIDGPNAVYLDCEGFHHTSRPGWASSIESGDVVDPRVYGGMRNVYHPGGPYDLAIVSCEEFDKVAPADVGAFFATKNIRCLLLKAQHCCHTLSCQAPEWGMTELEVYRLAQRSALDVTGTVREHGASPALRFFPVIDRVAVATAQS